MPKKRCAYHQTKETRLVTCVSCDKLVCVDDSYPIPIEELEKGKSVAVTSQVSKKDATKKRVRMCIPCHADFRSSEFRRVTFFLPHALGILIAIAVIVVGFPLLESTFQSATSPSGNNDLLVIYGWMFAILITFFMIPTLAATMIAVYLYQKWKTVNKYQHEKELFLKSVSSA